MALDASEFETWLYAFLFMAFLSAAVFTADRSGAPLFNLAFEVCVVYIPTAMMLIIVAILLRRKMEWSYHDGESSFRIRFIWASRL